MSPRSRCIFASLVLSLAFFGCSDSSPAQRVAPGREGGTTTSASPPVAASTAPASLGDPRIDNRDTSPLPDGAFLRFQSISRTPDPRTNHRWVLYEDGRLFLAFHSPDTAGPVPFDRPLPSRPTRSLPASEVEELRALVEQSSFFDLPPVVGREGEGGMWQVVTSRLAGRHHEVVFDRARHPLTDRLQRVASES